VRPEPWFSIFSWVCRSWFRAAGGGEDELLESGLAMNYGDASCSTASSRSERLIEQFNILSEEFGFQLPGCAQDATCDPAATAAGGDGVSAEQH